MWSDTSISFRNYKNGLCNWKHENFLLKLKTNWKRYYSIKIISAFWPQWTNSTSAKQPQSCFWNQKTLKSWIMGNGPVLLLYSEVLKHPVLSVQLIISQTATILSLKLKKMRSLLKNLDNLEKISKYKNSHCNIGKWNLHYTIFYGLKTSRPEFNTSKSIKQP